MLYDDHRIALIHKLAQELEQQLNIITVQAGRRFVENVDIAAFCQFAGQFQALHLATRKSTEGLAQGHVAQTDSLQQLQRLTDLPLSKEGECLCYRQRQNLLDRLILIGIAQRCGIIPPSAALLTGDGHRVCERHIRHDLALALAHRAAALRVEAEPLCADAVFTGENLTDLIHYTCIRGGRRSTGRTNRCLTDQSGFGIAVKERAAGETAFS